MPVMVNDEFTNEYLVWLKLLIDFASEPEAISTHQEDSMTPTYDFTVRTVRM